MTPDFSMESIRAIKAWMVLYKHKENTDTGSVYCTQQHFQSEMMEKENHSTTNQIKQYTRTNLVLQKVIEENFDQKHLTTLKKHEEKIISDSKSKKGGQNTTP